MVRMLMLAGAGLLLARVMKRSAAERRRAAADRRRLSRPVAQDRRVDLADRRGGAYSGA